MGQHARAMKLRGARQSAVLARPRQSPCAAQGASLIEVVVSFTITGLIFAAAIVPMMSSISRFEVTRRSAAQLDDHAHAGSWVARVGESVWRGADPPAGQVDWTHLSNSEWSTGPWTMRYQRNELRLRGQTGDWETLASGVGSLRIECVDGNGAWIDSPDDADIDGAIGLRFAWTATDSGEQFEALVAFADCANDHLVLELPKPKEKSKPYRRSDHRTKHKDRVRKWK